MKEKKADAEMLKMTIDAMKKLEQNRANQAKMKREKIEAFMAKMGDAFDYGAEKAKQLQQDQDYIQGVIESDEKAQRQMLQDKR